MFVVEHAIMSLTATRNSPPVSAARIQNPPSPTCNVVRTVVDHRYILLFRGTLERVAPEQLQTLASMERQEFVYGYVIDPRHSVQDKRQAYL